MRRPETGADTRLTTSWSWTRRTNWSRWMTGLCRPTRELAALAHSVERVLLLSATPLTSRVMTHLGLLHLLEPDLYKWTERTAFEQKFRLRKQLANAVFALDAEFAPLLPSTVAEIEELIPRRSAVRETGAAGHWIS